MKILHKSLAVLLCMLLSLSDTGIVFAEELDYTESDVNINSAIASDSQKTAVELKADGEDGIEEVPAKNREIKLIAGKGTINSESIILEDGKTLPQQLPEAIRTGWTFEGWYTAEVTENFWGDQEDESFSALLKKCGGNKEEAVKKDFSWIVESEGSLIEAGQELPANVDTLYAMYKPTNDITIRWHYNGWKKNTGVFLTHNNKEYESPIVLAELENFLTWDDHKFTGWYTADGTEWKFDNAITDRDNGSVYYISDNVVTEDLDLYAHWTGRVDPDTISLSHSNKLVEPGEDISVKALYFPLSADAPELEWSVNDDSNVVASQEISDDGLTITLSIDKDADALQSNKYVTVTAKSKTTPTLNSNTSITIGHSWKLAGYEDSTCDKPGAKHYQCTKHENAKKDVILNPDGHRFVKSDRITKEPTCVVEGSYTDIYTCIVCNATEQVVTKIPATGIHTWNIGEITTAPTCADTGIMTYTCTSCHLTRKETIPATGMHTWNIGEITTAPTCADTGIMTYTCTGCNLTREETIPATEQHKYEKTSTVVNREANCRNSGLHTDTYACTVCGAKKTEEVIDPATGNHDFYEFVNLNLGKRNHYQACKVCGETEFLYAEETKLDECVIVLSATDYTYNGEAKEPTVTVTDGSTKLVINEDYTVSYSNNVTVGTATVKVTGKGGYAGSETKTFSIKKANNLITAPNVSKTYSAKAQCFSIGVKRLGNSKLTYSSNNKSVTVNSSGKVTVKAKFMGKAAITIKSASTDEYDSASKKITITVNPPKPTLSNVKNTKGNKILVKWKKNSAVTGYQILYSTDKKFKNEVKTATVLKNSTVSKKINSLKRNKTYNVRIRAYKTVSGTKCYSEWSSVKKVTIRK